MKYPDTVNPTPKTIGLAARTLAEQSGVGPEMKPETMRLFLNSGNTTHPYYRHYYCDVEEFYSALAHFFGCSSVTDMVQKSGVIAGQQKNARTTRKTTHSR